MANGDGPTTGWQSQAIGAGVVTIGLIVIAVVFVLTIGRFTAANDVVAVLGALTGTIGTIVTAFFGIHATAKAGSDASQKVADAGKNAASVTSAMNDKAIAAASYVDPAKAGELLQKLNISQ